MLIHPDIRTIMLTGGRSAKLLFAKWSSSLKLMSSFENKEFFFGDERCVPPDDKDSNYRLTLENLFSNGIPYGARLHRMEAESNNLDLAALSYEKRLPSSIDLLLLSVGDDGHIASLFPYDSALAEQERLVVAVKANEKHIGRLTITPVVIKNAKKVVVMAIGAKKRMIYERALEDPLDVISMPARLVLDRTWIFDLNDVDVDYA